MELTFLFCREAGKHALEHFKLSNHPIAIEINKKYVHCYFCDAYVFNDNSHNEIQLVRDTLNQLATQKFSEARTRSGRILRQASVNFAKNENKIVEQSSKKADKLYTALCHHRIFLLTRIFTAWQQYTKGPKIQSPTVPDTPTLLSPPARIMKKRLAAGVAGLRNLGNTCYMNSALQALSHQTLFRECFRLLNVQQVLQPISSGRFCMRQTTIECFNEVTQPTGGRRARGILHTRLHGLSGGKGGTADSGYCGEEEGVDSTNQEASLCKSLHAIFRVMWSGKWAMVTPHAVLSAVWSKIPDFRGYSQQDAHEFLCELLSELQSELNEFPDSVAVIFSEPMRSVIVPSEIISSSFEGRLRSAVVCNTCNGVSEVIEPFYDLSLDFPPRYQAHCSSRASTNSPCSCALSELLDYFTARETLEDCIYSCSFCNEARGGESLEFQSATKQLSLHKPPDVLRLHLKRFRWHETDRAKISTHVSFPTTLDITPFCSPQNDTNKSSHLHYDLTSVIMHHGKGYTTNKLISPSTFVHAQLTFNYTFFLQVCIWPLHSILLQHRGIELGALQ
jgi:ubiquitin carboxyl-terminal hydrolase 44/49